VEFSYDFLDSITFWIVDRKWGGLEKDFFQQQSVSELNNSDDETFLSALSFRDDPVLENTSFKITVDAI
jgi:hypothetical protein